METGEEGAASQASVGGPTQRLYVVGGDGTAVEGDEDACVAVGLAAKSEPYDKETSDNALRQRVCALLPAASLEQYNTLVRIKREDV